MRTMLIGAVVLGLFVARAQAPDLHLRGDRFAPLTYGQMTPEQQKLTDAVLKGSVTRWMVRST